MQRFANRLAAVTALLAAVPESRETLMLELTSRIALLEIGRIAGIEEAEARRLFDEARAVAERLQDKAGHAFLLTSYGRLCGLAGDVGQYLACAERAGELAEGSDAVFEFEIWSVLAHAQLAVGRLAPARATADRALTDVVRIAGLREALGHSTAPGLCRVWWALASAHLGRMAEAQAAQAQLELLAELLRLALVVQVRIPPGARVFGHLLDRLVQQLQGLGVGLDVDGAVAEEDLPTNTFYGDNSPIEPQVLEHLRDAYRQETVSFPWQQGDVLMLDNMLAAHGRAAYRGTRKILVGMAQPVTRAHV